MGSQRKVFSSWAYDPRADGALCDRCSLNGKPPVPSEIRGDAALTLVAEAPGKTEEILGFPLVGPSGKETMTALDDAGLTRKNVSLCNVMCCRASEINYDAHMRTVNVRNKARRKLGRPELLRPHEACLPRLLKELKDTPGLLLMGKWARRAIIGIDAEERKQIDQVEESDETPSSRVPMRGFPGNAHVGGRNVPCLTTMHPAFVLRARRWTQVFRGDVKKAVRMVKGELEWIEPEMLVLPTANEFCTFMDEIEASGDLISYDVETDGLQPTEVNLRCIGIGTKNRTACVHFKSVQNIPEWHYTQDEHQRIIARFMQFFLNPQNVVCPQNGKYDHAVMESCGWFPGFEMKCRVFDTAIAHHVAWSEWAHDLNFLIAQYTDAPFHKGKDHDKWERDEELGIYCMYDVARTAYCGEKLLQEPALRAQKIAFSVDQNILSPFCRQLGNLGIGLDIQERDRLYDEKSKEMDEHMVEARRLAEEALEQANVSTLGTRELARGLNPGSYAKVGQLIYEALGVEPAPERSGGYTQLGALSTKADTLYFLMDRGMPDVVERMLLEVIDYRGAAKLRGTYCTVEPCSDGRVRPSWNPHVVVSGRLSCSVPSLLNLHRSIRSMYVASPGNVFVSCDKRQQEIRGVTVLSRDHRWLEAIREGKDLHKVNACDLLGIPSVDQVGKAQRQFTKTFVFAIQYLAGPKKAHQMIKNFLDPVTRKRPYRTRTLSEIAACHRRFWESHQEITDFHAKNRLFWENNGYLVEPIHGRRRYFLDGGGDESIKEELANFLIQSLSASDVNNAIQRVIGKYPPNFAGPNTGVVLYVYDALTLEVPAHRALEIGGDVADIMWSKYDGMEFPVDLAIGTNYGEKTECVRGANGEWKEMA